MQNKFNTTNFNTFIQISIQSYKFNKITQISVQSYKCHGLLSAMIDITREINDKKSTKNLFTNDVK